MTEFKRLTDTMYVASQLSSDDIARAVQDGFTVLINNRPDGEGEGQPTANELRDTAEAHHVQYHHIPVGAGGFSMPQIEQMSQAIDRPGNKTLAFCRSGTRSTLLWALARAKKGESIDAITHSASAAGYDVKAMRPTMELLARPDPGA